MVDCQVWRRERRRGEDRVQCCRGVRRTTARAGSQPSPPPPPPPPSPPPSKPSSSTTLPMSSFPSVSSSLLSYLIPTTTTSSGVTEWNNGICKQLQQLRPNAKVRYKNANLASHDESLMRMWLTTFTPFHSGLKIDKEHQMLLEQNIWEPSTSCFHVQIWSDPKIDMSFRKFLLWKSMGQMSLLPYISAQSLICLFARLLPSPYPYWGDEEDVQSPPRDPFVGWVVQSESFLLKRLSHFSVAIVFWVLAGCRSRWRSWTGTWRGNWRRWTGCRTLTPTSLFLVIFPTLANKFFQLASKVFFNSCQKNSQSCVKSFYKIAKNICSPEIRGQLHELTRR